MEVSVIIPVYNEELYLDRCILSVLDQPEVAEVILVDDHSTDKSMDICKRWERENEKIRVFTNIGIKGAGGAINTGLHQASKAYIAILGADDYFLEGRFKDTTRIFNQNKNIEVVSEPMLIITHDGSDIRRLNMVFTNNSISGYPDTYSPIDPDVGYTPITGLTIKKEVVEKTEYFDEKLKQTQDTDWILRLRSNAHFLSGKADRPVVVYYIHDKNTTANLTEAIYYRRLRTKKHFKSAIFENIGGIKSIVSNFRNFIEYDYLWLFGQNIRFKKIKKILLLPMFVYRIFSKNDPVFDATCKYITH